MANVAKRLSDIQVLDPQGRPIRLSNFWKHQPVVLMFVRHFGCMFCREQVARLQTRISEIQALGAEAVVVGNGSPQQAAEFQKEHGFDFPLVVDPKLEAYAAAGLKRGLATVLRLKTITNGLRAFKDGFRQGKTQGDPWQQGGTFVIHPDGRVAFEHVSKEAGDLADLDGVLSALRKSAA